MTDLTAAPHWTSQGIAYRVFGDGDPLVLLHGGAGSWEHWMLNVVTLSARFRVLAIDQPGYGDSMAPDWEMAVDDYLALVGDAIAEMAGPGPHLSAFSFGGYIAAHVAGRLGARSLSLIGSAGFGPPDGRPFTLDSRRKLAERLGRPPAEAELRAMHAGNLGKLMLWDKKKIDARAIDMQYRNVSRTRFDSRRLSWADGVPTAIGALSCPVMVIYGEHDAAAVPPVAERIARCRAARPDAVTQVIPGCGHWAMYEAPDTVNQLLIDFHGGA